MSTADADHFEARFRADPDPWRYEASAYERAKYARTLDACGPGPFPRALELGAANGVFSALLAKRCEELVTIDFSPTAVGLARERLAGAAHVTVLQGTIPDDLPLGDGFDLVVASEVLYYLPGDDFRRTVDRLPRLLGAGGRLVAAHWTGQAPDLHRSAAETHRALRTGSGLRPVPDPVGATAAPARGYLLDAFEMR
ncbi:SAM-dependent methyltransferase [Patulibacter sp. NPDC049589]|uniref:class I SAM-dependent methyltransferase n=1 Tax=Patulibacter sp. NPDC049589 TaxID=3154731 RepID=UPI003414FC5E